MNKFILPATLITAALLTGAPALAEQIRVPIGSQSADSQGVETPRRGMTKSQVEATYGAPESKNGPTGEPPIYYWEYPGFTVYFEADHVLHAVTKQMTVSN